jgi:hypothetical protein
MLAALASAASTGAVGCLGSDSTPRYRLSAGNVPGTLAERFRWQPREPRRGADGALLDRLLEEGRLTTAGFLLLDTETPRYVERDGSYYEVTAERTGTVEREHWIFWFDLIEGEVPADAEVFTSSLATGGGTDLGERYGLTERDQRVVEDAAGEIVREFDLHDPEADPPGRRGHVFLRRGESETDLLPQPPFTHVAFERNDGRRYARAMTERAAVELQRYTYRSERVADSAEAYAGYVRDRHLGATFERSSLPASQREILDAITRGGGRYEERAPLSRAMQTILKRLGLGAVETPEPKRVSFSEDVYFRYRDGYFAAQLEIFR